MTVKELLELLKKIVNQDATVYFDCTICGRTNSPFKAEYHLLIGTKLK